MAKCLQKFLPQAYTTVSSCQEKKGSVRTKRIEALYTKWGGASLHNGERGRLKDEKMRRKGEGEMGRGGDWKMRRGGDEKMGGGGDGESERISISISLFSLLPSYFFLLPSN